jgi:hypothetical protein
MKTTYYLSSLSNNQVHELFIVNLNPTIAIIIKLSE